MKTTELYIEQVIIGFLVLAIAALPWAPELRNRLGDISIAEGSVLLGLAFLLGIPFDRFADTLTERLDRHHRLQFALHIRDGQEFPAAKPAPNNNKLEDDIFAEDEYRLKGLRDKDAVVNWIEYHRSRIRLARALAVYGPALTLSLTLYMARSDHGMSHYEVGIWLSAVAAGYIVWGLVASPPKILRQQTQTSSKESNRESPLKSALFGEKLPRTNEALFVKYAEKWDRIDKKTGRVKKDSRGGLRIWSDEWRSLVVPAVVLVAALSFGVNYKGKTAWIAVCGALVTVISGWTWWRISSTYRTYLYNVCTTP